MGKQLEAGAVPAFFAEGAFFLPNPTGGHARTAGRLAAIFSSQASAGC
jgi:hypothetical protein